MKNNDLVTVVTEMFQTVNEFIRFNDEIAYQYHKTSNGYSFGERMEDIPGNRYSGRFRGRQHL